MMKLHTQPKGSNLCLQCTTATLLGISLEESIELFGHTGSNTMETASKVLFNAGAKVGKLVSIDNRKKLVLPTTCILVVEWKDKNIGHAVAVHNGVVYDSGLGIFESVEEYKKAIKEKNGRLDFYGEVTLPEVEVEVEEVVVTEVNEDTMTITVAPEAFGGTVVAHDIAQVEHQTGTTFVGRVNSGQYAFERYDGSLTLYEWLSDIKMLVRTYSSVRVAQVA